MHSSMHRSIPMLPKVAAALSALLLSIPAFLALAPGPATPPQDPPLPEAGNPAEDDEAPIAVDPFAPETWSLAEEWQGLYGTWQLMVYEHHSEILPASAVRGFATFQEGFMTLILHARSLDGDNDMLSQGGLHRFQVTDTGILQTATSMAHSSFNDDAENFWEEPNTPREFRMSLNLDDLTLTNPDGSRFIFRRIGAKPYPKEALEKIRTARSNPRD